MIEQFAVSLLRLYVGCYFGLILLLLIVASLVMAVVYPNWSPLQVFR